MDKILYESLLYDFYGELLKENQKSIYKLYVFDNYSLAEIAETEGISRQAVFDNYKRTLSSLKKYEEKLHMIEQYTKINQLVNDMKEDIKKIKFSKDWSVVEKLENTINEINDTFN